jgi:hypothetical protein
MTSRTRIRRRLRLHAYFAARRGAGCNTRDRWFESGFLQQRVYELSVAERRTDGPVPAGGTEGSNLASSSRESLSVVALAAAGEKARHSHQSVLLNWHLVKKESASVLLTLLRENV